MGRGTSPRIPAPLNPVLPALFLPSLAKSTSKNVSTSYTVAASVGGTALCTGEFEGSGGGGGKQASCLPSTRSSREEGGACDRSCPAVLMPDRPPGILEAERPRPALSSAAWPQLNSCFSHLENREKGADSMGYWGGLGEVMHVAKYPPMVLAPSPPLQAFEAIM